jgi:PAS domain S-box-containing protein
MDAVVSKNAEFLKDLGIILGFLTPIVAFIYRFGIKPRMERFNDFYSRANKAIDGFPTLASDVQLMKNSLGPNGGKSIGAMVLRTDSRLSLLIDSLSTLTWEARNDGQNVRVNRAFEDWCGWSAADLKGNGWKILLHPDDSDEYIKAWSYAVMDHRPFRYGPVRFIKKDGREEVVHVSANPTAMDNELTFWLGTIEREEVD